uniref:Uncharacterized protein n=1 Tax=Monodon monoceros TaxID=40151 RepID=A0A8C6F5W6_MONMO
GSDGGLMGRGFPFDKNFFGETLDEENVTLTLVPVNEGIVEDRQREPGVSSTSQVNVEGPPWWPTHPPETSEGFKACPKSSCSKPVYPLPTMMPPINKVSWDTLWNCTAGQKIGVYLRLQKHAYPEKDQYIPQSSQESRLQSRSRKREMVTNRTRKDYCGWSDNFSSGSHVGSMVKNCCKNVQPKAMNSQPLPTSVESFLPQASAVQWCVVPGRPLLADTEGWVRLQFRAGQAWVPDTPWGMISLFMLPVCTFPSPDLEDNMLYPECAKRNKKIMKR